MDSFSCVVFRLPPMVPMCEVLFTVFHDRGSHFASMFPLMEKLNGLFRHFARILPPMVDLLLNEDWDLLVIDDLMCPFGYFMATLKRRFWDSARNGPMPHLLIVYGTAAQMLNSAESVRAINSRDVFRPSLFSHRLFAFYENFAEIVLVNWITESYMMPNISKFGVPNFSWAELFRQTDYEFSDFIDRMGWPAIGTSAAVSLLPPAFSEFVDVPFSRGTVLLNALFGAMNALSEYHIIFAYDGPPN
ncbi:hypothetical protein niasHT_015219 [Heterodera trifolii]|uniref:Uncharacterized protein n=1 Tax=Heterodera trifolii TaxID=157864 RepID=A0ABD2L4I3_9BILA